MVQMVRGAATLPHGSGKVCMAWPFFLLPLFALFIQIH
jgi:hypothetical protein